MSKVIDATCANQKVIIGGIEIPCTILSKGKGPSEGLLFIDKTRARYLASNASDLENAINSLSAIIDKVIQIATGLDAASTSPGGQTANIVALTLLKTNFAASKDLLK